MDASSHRVLALAILAASPVVILMVHAVLARLLRRRSPQAVAVAAGLLGAVPMALVLAPVLGSPSLADLVYGALVYLSVAYSYFHLFNMSETARRIRILRELHASGGLRAAEITALYGGDAVIAVRLERLVATGQLALRDGRYVLAGRLLYTAARIVYAWRVLLGFERAG